MERYDIAFCPPLVADLRNFGTWTGAGTMGSDLRATAFWQKMLDRLRPPAQGAETADRLAPCDERRQAQGGAAALN